MYLDVDGDSVHTEADVLPSSGTTTAWLWLITNRNRDGTNVICSADPSQEVTINSYEVILRALGGTVEWGAFENLMSSAATSFGLKRDPVEMYAGFGGASALPPGKYRLARLAITPTSGSPTLLFAATSRLNPAGYTSFGCQCPGHRSLDCKR
jgi:hypothetical protein